MRKNTIRRKRPVERLASRRRLRLETLEDRRLLTVYSEVVDRHLFYNRSVFDGGNVSINTSDDAAIATDKSAYLPEDGLAVFENVSSYTRGINGIMIDLGGPGSHASISLSTIANDFVFKVGNNNSPNSWVAAPTPSMVSVRAGAGVSGSDRVEVIWTDGAIKNQWLQVQVLPTSNTGLESSDEFYFGSKVGDVVDDGVDYFHADLDDGYVITDHVTESASILDPWDIDRSGVVTTAGDLGALLGNVGCLARIDVNSGGPSGDLPPGCECNCGDPPTVDLNGSEEGVDYETAWIGLGPVNAVDPGATIEGYSVYGPYLYRFGFSISNPSEGDVLTFTAGGIYQVVTHGGGTGFTLVGVDTIESFEHAVRSLKYNNTNGGPTVADVHIAVAGWNLHGDGGASITIHTNYSLVVDLNGSANGRDYDTVWKNEGPVFVADANASIGPPYNRELLSLTATITDPSPGDVLTAVTDDTDITAEFEDGVLRLSGLDTREHYQQVLRSIEYDNSNDGPPVEKPTVTVEFVASNGTMQNDPVESTITIPKPKVSIGDSQTVEPPYAGAVPMAFMVTLDRASSSPVTVQYTTQSGSAIASSDFTPQSGQVTIPAHQTTAMIEIQILGDVFFETVEQFTVALSDAENATLDDSQATGQIADASEYVDSTEAPPDSEGCDCECAGDGLGISSSSGDVSLSELLAAGPLSELAMAGYQSGDNPHPIVSVDVQVPAMPGTMLLLSADSTLTFGDLPPLSPIYYESTTGVSEGSDLVFATLVDATQLATGTYYWSLLVNYHFDVSPGNQSPPMSTTATYRGRLSIVNRIESPYGNRWWISGVDQLVEQTASNDQPEGVTYVSGDGVAGFYAKKLDGGYETPYGYRSTLVKNGDLSFTLTDMNGNKKFFAADGLLSSARDVNGNVIDFDYNANDAITTMSDGYGHTIVFDYSGDKLSSVTDSAGRITSVTVDTNNTLTSIVSPPLIPGEEPVSMSLTYDPTTLLVSNVTYVSTALTEESTTYTFDADTRRLSSVRHDYDNSPYSLVPAAVSGLVDLASGVGTEANPATLVSDATRTTTISDELGHPSTETFNSKGQLISRTDFNGNTTIYDRDDNGNVITMTQSDPDGSGPLGPAITTYSYDGDNLTDVFYPDGSAESWVYDPNWNVVVLHIGKVTGTEYILDQATGNVLEVYEWGFAFGSELRTSTYTYTPEPTLPGDLPGGLLLTETDPLERVTRYEYEEMPGASFGQVKSITYAYQTADEAMVQFQYDANGNLSGYLDEMERLTTYLYNARNELIQTTGPDPDGSGSQTGAVTKTTYDGWGRVRSQTDARNSITDYFYNGRGQLVQMVQPDPVNGSPGGPTTIYGYDAKGNLETVTDPLNRITRYEYDPMGNLLKSIMPDPDGDPNVDGPTTTYSYTTECGCTDSINLQSMTDPMGYVTSYEYDIMGRLIKTMLPDPDGEGPLPSPFTTSDYDDGAGGTGVLLSATDALGRTTYYEYDSFGRLTHTILPPPVGTNPVDSPVLETVYDLVGNVTSRIDALLNETAYLYDFRDRLTKVTQPDPNGNPNVDGPITLTAYNDAGQVTSRTDPLSHITTYEYDGAGRLTSVTLPDPDDSGPLELPVTSTTYDANGNVLTQTDAMGNVTRFVYDRLNRRTAVIQPDPGGNPSVDGPTTLTAYNPANEVTSTTDPLEHITSYEYDGMGRQKRVTMPDPGGDMAPYTVYTYDDNGNLLTETDALDNQTIYDYDPYNRLEEVIQPNGDPISYTYDAVGNRLTLTDGMGNTTTFGYDNLNRLETETNELNLTRTYEYDLNNNRKTLIDRNGRVTEHVYDHLNRRKEERWMESEAVIRTLYFAYDDAGRLMSASDPAASYVYTYDNLNRQTSVTTTLDGLAPVVVLTSGYDPNGNRATLGATIGGTGDFANTYIYDPRNRLTQLEQTAVLGGNDVAWKSVGFTYTDASQLSQVTRAKVTGSLPPDRVAIAVTDNLYDPVGRVTDIDHDLIAAATISHEWTYDRANLVESYLNSVDGALAYDYDESGQLTDVSGVLNDTYAYDDNGNRTNEGYVTDAPNRLVEDDRYTYEYDNEGNLVYRFDTVTGRALTFEWDHRNRLVAIHELFIEADTYDLEYEYDLFNRRVSRAETVTVDGGEGENGQQNSEMTTTTEKFIYDGDDVVFDFYKPHGGNFALERRYLHGPSVDQVLAQENVANHGTPISESAANRVYWMLTDNLGTVRDLIDANGAAVQHYQYGAFGQVLSGDTSLTRYLYTAREFDATTGLQYNRERWYDSHTGRWLSEDPIGFLAGDANLYRYVGNKPTNLSDPSGLDPTTLPIPWPGRHPSAPNAGSLETLATVLASIANSCPAKEEAARIGAAIKNTFNMNWKVYVPWAQTVKGYWCYEWAYGFEDAFTLESSGEYFKASLGGGSALDGRIHAWIKITSLETDKSIYVDDAFFGDGVFVHTSKPLAPPYDFGAWFPTDSPRDAVSVPDAYDHKGVKH